jgi:hypothetical protein
MSEWNSTPQKLGKAKLPAYLRWEWDGKRSMVHYRCHCSPEEGRGGLTEVCEAGSSATAVCPRCGTVLQLRASMIVKDSEV